MSKLSSANPNQLREQTAALSEIASSPALHEALAKIAAAPPASRLSVAEEVASVDALRAAGVKVPADLRISTRYFENSDAILRGDVLLNPEAESTSRAGGGTLCVSVGEIVCVTYGRPILAQE